MRKLNFIRNQAENVILFALVAIIFGFFARLDIDWHHDGLMLKTAMDVAEGQVIFRDTFNQYGALTTFLQALAVRIFGAEVLSIRLLTVFFYGLSILWLNRIGKLVLTRPFRYLSLIFFLGLAPFYAVPFHPWSSVYALFFLLLAEERMLLFLRDGRPRQLLWAGLATVGAFGSRHPCGMVALAAGILVLGLWSYLNWEKRRNFGKIWGAFGIGLAAPLLLWGIWLGITGSWNAYWFQSFGYTARFAAGRGGGSWADICETMFPFASFFWIFPLVSLGVLWFAVHRLARRPAEGSEKYLPLLVLSIYGLASWHQFFPVPCVRHLYWASVPMFPVLALAAERLWRHAAWPKRRRIALLALLLIVPLAGVGYRLFTGGVRLYYVPKRVTTDVPGARGMLIFPREAMALENARTLFGKLPPELKNRPYLNYTPDGFFSVLFPSQKNLHPMTVNWEDAVYPDYRRRIEELVRERKPIILSKQNPVPFPGYRVFGVFMLTPVVPNTYFYINVPVSLP